jgi:hypothetical protein
MRTEVAQRCPSEPWLPIRRSTWVACRLARIALGLTARQPWFWFSLLGVALLSPGFSLLAPLGISGAEAASESFIASVLFVALATGSCWGLHATTEVRWIEPQLSHIQRLLARFAILLTVGAVFAVVAAAGASNLRWDVFMALLPRCLLPLLSLTSGALLLRQLAGDRALAAPLLLGAFWIVPAAVAPGRWLGRVLHSALNVHAHLRWAGETSETPLVTWSALAPVAAFLLLAALVSRSTRS